MTLRVVTVKSAGGDYSSLNAAFVGEAGNLVSLDRQLEIDCYNFADSVFSWAPAANWTSDATHTMLVVAVDNHQGVYGGAGGTSAYSNSSNVWSDVKYSTLRGISCAAGLASADGTATNVVFDRCISNSGGFQFAGNNNVAVDCLAFTSSSPATGFSVSTPGNTASCYNCTFYGTGVASTGFLGTGATIVAKNCAAIGVTNGFDSATTWTGSSNCASTDANVPTSGSGHRASQTISLFDPVASDYRLLSTDTGAKGFGADLSADATYPFAIDFIGAARTAPWDIGCSIAYAIPHRGRFPRSVVFSLAGMM